MSKLTVTLDEKEIGEAIKEYVSKKHGIQATTVYINREEHDRFPGSYIYTASASQ